MGLIKKGIQLGAGYAIVSKVTDAMKEHDESKARMNQEEQQIQQQQQQQQLPYTQTQGNRDFNTDNYGSLSVDNNAQSVRYLDDGRQHASFCNGTCEGKCNSTATDTTNRGVLPTYTNNNSIDKT